jgi:aminopeptidase N
MRKFFSLVFLINSLAVAAMDPYPRSTAINVKHYTFQLEVNDSTDIISGHAKVSIVFSRSVTEFDLDLVAKQRDGQGMVVSQVTLSGNTLRFTHENDRLRIFLSTAAHAQEELTFQIAYSGIPRDGLTIGKNKFGDRGFFGDNWPDRGHHWLPVIDHPSDKASVDFIVIAPLQYSVVANGLKTEESLLDRRRKLTHWHEEVEIPVKVMVVGIARFAVQYVGMVNDAISVQSWVYPQNREEGFRDYAVALKILDFFDHHIGPYPYKKLANVQSKTRWGGLENANAIFYAENLINGKEEQEPIIAHEEAHQWFGNSATENDWHHVWLSEGFATYFANLYLEYAYGHDRLVEEEKIDRDQVVRYFRKNQGPVVDTTVRDISALLNANTYQKGGWVLHMLRHSVGDIAFWKGVQQYYSTYRNGNAMTGDFQRTMEEASGKDLSEFFRQWLWTGGHPRLSGRWTYDSKAKSVTVTIDQLQPGVPFKFPLDVELISDDGVKAIRTLDITKKNEKLSFLVTSKPQQLILDPDTWLLFEGDIKAN